MEILEIDCSRIGSGKIFPDHIQSQDWIGYHGTSSHYSVKIEKTGFSQAKPIAEADIDFAIAIMQREGVCVEAVQEFRKLASISFFPISELCLAYCGPTILGGQGVGFLKTAIDGLLSEHPKAITAEELGRLQSIDKQIAEIRHSEPVIYAVCLQGLSCIKYQTLTKAVHVYEPVVRDRIIAKLRVNQSINFGAIDVNKHKKALWDIYWSDQDHYIKRIG